MEQENDNNENKFKRMKAFTKFQKVGTLKQVVTKFNNNKSNPRSSIPNSPDSRVSSMYVRNPIHFA